MQEPAAGKVAQMVALMVLDAELIAERRVERLVKAPVGPESGRC